MQNSEPFQGSNSGSLIDFYVDLEPPVGAILEKSVPQQTISVPNANKLVSSLGQPYLFWASNPLLK